FSAGEVLNGRRIPFDATMVVSRRLDVWQVWLERLLRTSKIVFDLCALAWLALWVAFDLRELRRGRRPDGTSMTVRQQFVAWFFIVASVEAFLYALPWFTRLTLLVAGDDPMTYESYAR